MQQSIKSILTDLADQFDEWYRTGDESTETLKAANETWAFAAAELRGAAANIRMDLQVAEMVMNLYIKYFHEWSDEYLLEQDEDLSRLEERAKHAVVTEIEQMAERMLDLGVSTPILDTMEGVEADVIVPEDIPCVDPTRKDWHPTYVHEEDDPF